MFIFIFIAPFAQSFIGDCIGQSVSHFCQGKIGCELDKQYIEKFELLENCSEMSRNCVEECKLEFGSDVLTHPVDHILPFSFPPDGFGGSCGWK